MAFFQEKKKKRERQTPDRNLDLCKRMRNFGNSKCCVSRKHFVFLHFFHLFQRYLVIESMMTMHCAGYSMLTFKSTELQRIKGQWKYTALSVSQVFEEAWNYLKVKGDCIKMHIINVRATSESLKHEDKNKDQRKDMVRSKTGTKNIWGNYKKKWQVVM